MWALKEGEVKTVKKDLKHSTTCLTSTATGLTPSPYRPHPQPLSKGRGE
jgi:hypothetical protein